MSIGETIAFMAMLVSLLSFSLSIFAFIISQKINKAERALVRAPVLIVEEIIFNGNKFTFIDAQKIDTIPRTFTLDRRCFKSVNSIESSYSLLMDVSLPGTLEKEKISVIGFDTMKIKNIGYSLISIEVIEINMMLKGNRKPIDLTPSQNNVLRLSLINNSIVNLQLSCKASPQADSPFDMLKLTDKSYYEDLAAISESNLINTYCKSMADLWTNISIKCKTKNIHNEEYYQIIRFFIENNVYYVETYDIEKCR